MKDRVSKTVSRHVALLRGINVGGKNMLPMKMLTEIFATTGCTDIATYIQSGNVVFCAEDKIAKGLAEAITKQVEKQFGLKVPVVIRSAAELDAVIRGNPFGAAEEMLHVLFLADRPGADLVTGLDLARSTPDEYVVAGRDIYAKLVTGAAKTKLTNAYFDSKLKTVSTMRNWRTVLKLAEMTA
jgi:uncharacterized protein (DUF1697 family)